ncbi:class I SAM-dependent methyltransferase [Blastomonas aquatica]|uniref:ATP synthase subunit beta n=1 Tax=Blastomonas aquatica TaxID=1510276 RepID=A0ABQ1IW35_9SPHN|nr:SAM-dependent methyltransferase [Blastomonas aquatica]GGB52634.1 ATP synthase subunit beta [Blastomonas aquatica]
MDDAAQTGGDGGDAGLEAIFRRLIGATGPISVAHYMAEANAHYYNRADPFGATGDFITAPEISQMFGEMIGLWLADQWQRAGKPALCHYVEFGPGRGTLVSDALRAAEQFGFRPRVHLIEGSSRLRQMQQTLIPQATWHDGLDSVPREGPLLIVANEFLDALPVRQVVRAEQGWRERVVVHNGERFLPVAGARPMDSAVPAVHADSPVGTILETCPAASGMAFEIATRLKAQSGTALFIDYGYNTADTGPHTGSTLQAVRAHQKVDPFADPGLADLTALVDFAQLKQIALAGDVDWLGPVGQGEWLMALGIAERAATLARTQPSQAQALMDALDRLVSPEQMGTLFKVMAYRGPGWPKGEGFGG